jgi:hypothetical protein
MRRAPVAVILLANSVLLFAQENVQTAKTSASPKPSVTAPATKPKLTEQQKRGQSLLESAETSAGGLETVSRIVAYTQIARVYQTSDKKKAVELLQQAYESLRSLQLDLPNKSQNMQMKQQLQQQLLKQYVSTAPERVDRLLDQMEPQMRGAALQALLSYYEKTKNLDRPVALAVQLALETEMPYSVANDLMDKLGSGNPEQIRQLFVASLTSYQNHEHLEFSSSTDFAYLISKAYGKVPDDSESTAIDEVLSQARKADEKNANVSVNLGFDKGAVQFKSIYDYQLFAVLPVLEQIDSGKAKRLLKEREDVNTFASKYPEGMNSLSKNGRPNSIGLHIGNSAKAAAQSPQLLEEQHMNAILKDATDHPDDALANAAGLSPRYALPTYMGIARANAKTNTAATEIALAKGQDLLAKVPVWMQTETVSDIIHLYEQLGDKENAQKAIESGTKVAAVMYKQESDADDPNMAPKAYWMATNAWRNLVDAGYQLNPTEAVTLLRDAPDDEIRVFAQISLAKRLLGNTSPGWDLSMSAHKNGMTMSMISVTSDKDDSK